RPRPNRTLHSHSNSHMIIRPKPKRIHSMSPLERFTCHKNEAGIDSLISCFYMYSCTKDFLRFSIRPSCFNFVRHNVVVDAGSPFYIVQGFPNWTIFPSTTPAWPRVTRPRAVRKFWVAYTTASIGLSSLPFRSRTVFEVESASPVPVTED